MIGGNTWKANWILLRLFWDMQALIGHVLLQAQVPESTCQRQGNVHIEAFASVLASCLQLHQFIGSSYLNLSWGSGLPSCRCICRHLSALCWLGFWPWYGSTKLRFQHRVARHVESFDYVKISYSLNFLLIQKEMNIKKLPINEKIKIKKFAHQWEYQKSTNIYIYIYISFPTIDGQNPAPLGHVCQNPVMNGIQRDFHCGVSPKNWPFNSK